MCVSASVGEGACVVVSTHCLAMHKLSSVH